MHLSELGCILPVVTFDGVLYLAGNLLEGLFHREKTVVDRP
jgi:hypothetical protein